MKRFARIMTSLLLFTSLAMSFNMAQTHARIDRGGGVPEDVLPGALQGLDIKDHHIPLALKDVGVIHALTGHVVVTHMSTKEAYFGREGDIVYENDSLDTLVDSRCRIRFLDEDVITMASETSFAVDRHEDRSEEGEKSSLFSVMKGKVMFYALRLFQYKDRSFSVKTPTAVVGVRGTKFATHVYQARGGDRAGGAGIQVADNSGNISPYLAELNRDGEEAWVTLVGVWDGRVEVDGVILNPGDIFDTLTKELRYDPCTLQRLESTIEGGVMEECIHEEKTMTETDEGFTHKDSAMDEDERFDISQQLTSMDAGSEEPEPEPEPEPELLGYFAAMLTNLESTPSVQGAYVSSSPQPIYDDVSYAYSVEPNTTDYVLSNGESGDIEEVGLNGAVISTNIPTYWTYVGANEWVEWGYWETDEGFNWDGPYAFDNPTWWAKGYQLTPVDTISGLSGTALYNGTADGTYWTDSGGVRMTGAMSMAIDFGNRIVSDYNLFISDESQDYWVDINKAGGQLVDNRFTLTPGAGGAWGITGSTAVAYGNIGGFVAGEEAQAVGGAGVIMGDSLNAASFGFGATKAIGD